MMKKRMTAGMLATLMAAVLPVSACAAQNSAPQPQLNTAEHMQYMNGYTDGTFRPDASITRAEASKLLASLLVNKVENEDHLFRRFGFRVVCGRCSSNDRVRSGERLHGRHVQAER